VTEYEYVYKQSIFNPIKRYYIIKIFNNKQKIADHQKKRKLNTILFVYLTTVTAVETIER
jgi:hypothetical protein